MNILISNDDGITAPGLVALVHSVRDLGRVMIVAPDSPQSAAGHSITLRRPLTVQYVRLPGEHTIEGMSVDGRPADCVRLAVRQLLPARPDLVLSGINAGANVGVNLFYSGTVAAAAEGAMFGIPAVAFSAALVDTTVDKADFVTAAQYCRAILEKLLSSGLEAGELVNVNIPVLSEGNPRGVRVCEQSDADVSDRYVSQDSPEGIKRYRLADEYDFNDPHVESDVAFLNEGYITVTPLRTDLTDHARMARLEGHCNSNTPP